MRLTVVGCSGSMAGPDAAASAYLVEEDGFAVLLDLGNGAYGPLQRFVTPARLDAVVLSHLHADHCIDVTSYAVDLRYGPARPARRVPVIGPSGTRSRLDAAYDPLARRSGMQELFEFRTPSDGELGPFEVSFAEMNHPIPTYGIRLTAGGRSLVYSGDTGESDALVGLAKEADVLLCEASFGPDEAYVPDLHLTGRQAGEHAARAGVGRLIVTHVPPWNAREVAVGEAAGVYDGAIEAAVPGAVYSI